MIDLPDNEQVTDALLRGVDDSAEKREQTAAEADKVTAAHGIEGDAPIDEETRARRIQMNFYGSVTNILMYACTVLEDIRTAVCGEKVEVKGKDGTE